MRLILQPKSTKKTVTPYSQLLNKVVRIRLVNLHRLFFLICLFGLFWSFSTAFAVFTSLTCVALSRKVTAHVAPITGLSSFQQVFNRIVSHKSALSLLYFSISSAVYFVFVARPSERLYTVELLAGIPNNSRGLTKAVNDGLINHTLVYLNENIVYNVFFAIVLTVGYVAYQYITDSSRFLIKRHDLSPKAALLADMTEFSTHTAMLCASLAVLVPVLYLLFRGLFLTFFFIVPWRGYFVAGTTHPSIFGTLISYPFRWCVLLVLWQVANKAFNAYVCRGPIHNGKTISDSSPDPNGTLLTGINHKPHTLSHLEGWLELAIIAQDKGERRQTIYGDATWKPIFNAFDKYITTITNELSALIPKPTQHQPEEITKPVAKPEGRLIHVSEKQVTNATTSPVDQVVLGLQKRADTAEVWPTIKETVEARWDVIRSNILSSKYGSYFRTTNARQVQKILADENVLEYAIVAIAHLIVHSYDEDTMGYVQVDIGACLNEYDALLTTLSELERDLGVSLPSLQESTKNAFSIVCTKFSPYFDTLAISEKVRARV